MPISARLRPARPLVIAHRGASAERAEHTLAAYVRAIESGADGLECDVRLTSDGQLVCIHDRTVDRTSNGSGAVSALTLSQLRKLDFASWHEGPGNTAGVLTLQALLELIADTDRPLHLLVEAKHPNRHGPRLERALADALARFNLTGSATGTDLPPATTSSVTVMSFAKSALRRSHQLLPDVATVLLMEAARGPRRTGLLPDDVGIAGPSLRLLRHDPHYVERAHALGNQVYVWTVDDELDVRYVADLGVDAVITNDPARAVAIVTGG